MPQIRFTRTGANTLVGNFAPGDLLRCGEPLARHLVQEARVAVRVEPPAEQPAPTGQASVADVAPAPSPRRRRATKVSP